MPEETLACHATFHYYRAYEASVLAQLKLLMNCPFCESATARRSRRHSLLDYLSSLVGILPWRCTKCHKRFRAQTFSRDHLLMRIARCAVICDCSEFLPNMYPEWQRRWGEPCICGHCAAGSAVISSSRFVRCGEKKAEPPKSFHIKKRQTGWRLHAYFTRAKITQWQNSFFAWPSAAVSSRG